MGSGYKREEREMERGRGRSVRGEKDGNIIPSEVKLLDVS